MSNAAVFLGGADVEVAAAGALSGDGAIGDPLQVNVDGVTITVNGSNELEGASTITIGDTQVAYATSANTLGGNASLTFVDDSNVGAGRILTLTQAVAGGTPPTISAQLATIDNGDTTGDAYLAVRGSHGISSYISVTNGSTEGTSTYLSGEGYLDLFTKDGTSAARFWDDEGNVLRMAIVPAGIQLGDGIAIQSDTTTAHTALFQAYDVNGTTYRTFATLLNGDVPDFTIAPPSGGTVTVQATTFKSSDGTSGATAGPFTVVSSIQVKNGLVVTLTGT